MKNVLLGLAAVCLTFACASQQKAAVSSEAAPGAECATTECATSCDEAKKSECSTEAKSECSTEAKTCPVTGKPIS